MSVNDSISHKLRTALDTTYRRSGHVNSPTDKLRIQLYTDIYRHIRAAEQYA